MDLALDSEVDGRYFPSFFRRFERQKAPEILTTGQATNTPLWFASHVPCPNNATKIHAREKHSCSDGDVIPVNDRLDANPDCNLIEPSANSD